MFRQVNFFILYILVLIQLQATTSKVTSFTTVNMEKSTKITWIIAAISICVACIVITGTGRSHAIHEMDFRIHVLQREAEDASNTPYVRLYNNVAAMGMLRPLRLEAVLPHTQTCTPPSFYLRFLPLVGDYLLKTRFR